MAPIGRQAKVFKFEIPPEQEGPEIIPWTHITRPRSVQTGHKLVRHTLSPISTEHVGIYVDGLDYIRKNDIGRTLVVDYDTVTHQLFAVITDPIEKQREATKMHVQQIRKSSMGQDYKVQVPPTQFSQTFPGIQTLLGYERNRKR